MRMATKTGHKAFFNIYGSVVWEDKLPIHNEFEKSWI